MKMGCSHSNELISALGELQQSLEKRLAKMNSRLAAIESRVAVLEATQGGQAGESSEAEEQAYLPPIIPAESRIWDWSNIPDSHGPRTD
jgi:hypothetical protein